MIKTSVLLVQNLLTRVNCILKLVSIMWKASQHMDCRLSLKYIFLNEHFNFFLNSKMGRRSKQIFPDILMVGTSFLSHTNQNLTKIIAHSCKEGVNPPIQGYHQVSHILSVGFIL